MFGIKILSESSYNDLLQQVDEACSKEALANNLLQVQTEETIRLRKILLELDKEAQKYKDNSVSVLNEFEIIRTNDVKCSSCKLNSEGCLKLTFANKSICIRKRKQGE